MDLISLPQVHEKTNGSPPPRDPLMFYNHLEHSWLVRGMVLNTQYWSTGLGVRPP